jgi:GT2 family glycosyltransferase
MTPPEHNPHPSRVTVAILNYNGRQLLEVVLPSLVTQSYRDFETVVVDDCSTDDSVRYLHEQYPEVRIVVTGTANVGVAAALNIAVRSTQSELVALLNNDIELDPDWLGELVTALDHHPEASSASCKLLNYWRREELDGAGDVFTRAGIAGRRGHGEPDSGQYDRDEYVFAPTAGAALYRASALAAVGPFDESFYAYFEDADWGMRAQLLGHRCRYVPNAVAYHMGSATTGGELDPKYLLLLRRNLLALLLKDLPVDFLLRNAPRIAWAQLHLLARSARAGGLSVHMRALVDLLRRAPGWLRARKEIQKRRVIDGSELEQLVREWAC